MLPGFDSLPLKRDFAKLMQRAGQFLRSSGGIVTGDITMSGAKIKFAKGADIASASIVDLTTATGNSVNLTGTTAVTGWTMTAGQMMRVNFTAATPITYNATTNRIQGGSSIVGEVGSYMLVYYDGTTTFVDYNLGNGAAASGPSYTTVPAAITTTGATLTANAVGAPTRVNSATATATTLPAASALILGQSFTLVNVGAGIATFNRAGSDTITGGNLSAATSISLNQGETVTLTCDSSSTFFVTNSNVSYFGAPAVWQDVTASRVLGGLYTNTSGRSRRVAVSGINGTANNLIVNVGAVTIHGGTAQTATRTAIYFEVPAGSQYSVSVNTSSLSGLTWSEW